MNTFSAKTFLCSDWTAFFPKNGLQTSAPRPRRVIYSRFQLFISVRAFTYRQQTDLECAAAERWLAGVMAERALSKSAR